MKAIIFTTSTVDTHKLIRSFLCLGHETEVHRYDVGPQGIDMVGITAGARPDLVIWIGAIKRMHHSFVPDFDILARVNAIAPMVHICSDAADPPWWPDLEEFQAHNCFRLQVSIDGNHDSPIGRFGLVRLTPIDPAPFPASPWASRAHQCGFAGGVGSRADIIEPLRAAGLIELRINHLWPYEEICAFYTTCRTIINDARTGTGTRRHVKGRFVEAGLAGAIVIEPGDSPASQWFAAGEDYLVWNSPAEAIAHVRETAGRPDREEMARRFHAKMMAEHAAEPFWRAVLARMAL